jgi:DNA-binding CsgD family transcriptional regulator/tetratricopeptide (TPR) repeat protein
MVTLAAIDAAVLVDTGSTLAFRHDLLRRAVLRSTPPSIVRALQRRAAILLIARWAAAERIAACLLADDRPPDPGETEQLLGVGRSLRQSAPGVAADLLRRALDGVRPDDPRSLPATIELGWALAAAGRAREVDSLIHDRVGHATGPLPVELLRLESVALSLTGRLGEASARYDGIDPTRLAEEFGTDDASGAELADAAAELAFLRLTSGRLDEAARLIDWVDTSPAPGSAFRRAMVSMVRAWLLGTEGAFEEGVGLARAALSAIAQDDRLAITAGSPTLALGLALDNLGDGEGALAVFRRSEAAAGPSRWTPPLLQFGAALALYRQGEWDDALAEAEAGLLAAEETGLGLGAFWPCSIGALISCSRGRLDDARGWLDRIGPITLRQEWGMEWLVYASAAVQEAQGHTDEAADILEAMAAAIIEAGAPALLLTGATDVVRLAQATGRTASAARVVGQIEAMTRRTASPIVAALACWARALTEDGADAAERAGDAGGIEAAADLLAAHGRVPEAARARHDAAVLAARRGASSDARRLATQAFVVYDQLGAEQLHRRLRSELRACGLAMRPRRSPPRPTDGWDSLTTSESTIVDLAGRGLTNTQIGERLYVSRRTVESHLGRVYAKLRLSTRAQLVAASARRATDDGAQSSPG